MMVLRSRRLRMLPGLSYPSPLRPARSVAIKDATPVGSAFPSLWIVPLALFVGVVAFNTGVSLAGH